MTKTCCECKKTKSVTEFHQRRKSYQPMCKACNREYCRTYRQERRAKGLDQNHGSPDRQDYWHLIKYAKREGYTGPHLAFQEFIEIKQRANGRCEDPFCGSYVGLQVDHIIPLKAGGTNLAGNIRYLCERHNNFRRPRVGASSSYRSNRLRAERVAERRWASITVMVNR